MSAYVWANKKQKMELHAYERPLALQTAQAANLNRDSKKRKTPFSMDEFYLYQPLEDKNLPSSRYGAAAVYLAKEGILPAFSLFCFPELRKNSSGPPPTVIALMHPQAILLAPTEGEGAVSGLLIAEVGVSDKLIEMTTPCGKTAFVYMPSIEDEVMAEEDVTLRLG